MPRAETVVRVLVASPDDVQPERDAVDEVVRELNSTWASKTRIRLDVLRWEIDTRPGISIDAQQVINEQIGDDYDIFLAIVWSRAGTPTSRAESGTIEEFRQARSRCRANPASVRLMVYFKDAAIPPSQIVLEQLEGVRRFQQELKDAGILYRKFTELDEFKKLLRMHLSKEAHSFGDPQAPVRGASSTELQLTEQATLEAVSSVIGLEEAEDGFLDLVELALDGLESSRGVAERLSELIEDLTDRVTRSVIELEEAKRASGTTHLQRAKAIVNRAAAALERFATQVEADLPIFEASYSQAMEAYGRAALLLGDFEPEDGDMIGQLQGALKAIQTMRVTMDGARSQMASFRTAVGQAPRITTAYNRAKRRTLEVLHGLDRRFDTAINLAGETERLLRGLLEASNRDHK